MSKKRPSFFHLVMKKSFVFFLQIFKNVEKLIWNCSRWHCRRQNCLREKCLSTKLSCGETANGETARGETVMRRNCLQRTYSRRNFLEPILSKLILSRFQMILRKKQIVEENTIWKFLRNMFFFFQIEPNPLLPASSTNLTVQPCEAVFSHL